VGSSFLVIAVQSFTSWDLFVDGDRCPISITRKNRDHRSPQSEKKLEKAQNTKKEKEKEKETKAN
jgi:hypothetical protein